MSSEPEGRLSDITLLTLRRAHTENWEILPDGIEGAHFCDQCDTPWPCPAMMAIQVIERLTADLARAESERDAQARAAGDFYRRVVGLERLIRMAAERNEVIPVAVLLVDYREPTAEEIAYGQTLEQRAVQLLSEPARAEALPPTAELTGADPDLTGELTSAEYLAAVREGEGADDGESDSSR